MDHRASFMHSGWLLSLVLAAPAAGQTPPANDLCDNAGLISLAEGCPICTSLGGGTFVVYGDTRAATIDGTAPGCGGVGNTARGVWYRFVGTGRRVRLSTDTSAPGTLFDTQLSVYCGSSCATIGCIAFNDDAGQYNVLSELEFCARAGVRYWILVNAFGGQAGNFGLEFGEVLDTSGQPIACCDAQPCGDQCTFTIPPDAAEERGAVLPGPIGPEPRIEVCISDMSYTNATQFNDGCNLAPPPGEERRYGTVLVGQTIWGNIWANNNSRDRDWFLFESMPPGCSLIRYEASAEGPVTPRLYFSSAIMNFSNCAPALGFFQGGLQGCGQHVERITIADGSSTGQSGESPGNTIGFRLDNAATGGYPCGTNTRYWLTLHDVIQVGACPPLVAPPGAQDETATFGPTSILTFSGNFTLDGFHVGEPCYDVDPDGPRVPADYNLPCTSGCDSTRRMFGCDPPSNAPITDHNFLRLTPGVPIIGKVSGSITGGGAVRDLDYYKFEIAQRSAIALRIDSSAPMMALITENSCHPDAIVYATAATRGRCIPETWIEAPDLVTMDAGTYIVAVAMQDAFVEVGSGAIFGSVLCADPVSAYALTLDAEPLTDCPALCPPGAFTENEPCAVTEEEMFHSCLPDNDGCSRVPYTSIELPAGTPACGTLFSVFEPPTGADPELGDRFFVDQDYWSFSLPMRSTVTFSAAADGPVRVQLLATGAGGAACADNSAPIIAEANAGACLAGDEVTIEVAPGAYALAAAPGSVAIGLSFGDYACGEHLTYTLRMSSALACCLGNADHAEPGRVDFEDVMSVLANYGAADASGLGAGDADCDGQVNFADITFVLANFMDECP